MKKIIVLFIALLSLGSCKKESKEILKAEPRKEVVNSTFPKPLGYVSDFEKTLTTDQVAQLNKILEDYQKASGNKIVIVSLNDEATKKNFDQYAIDLSDNWQVSSGEVKRLTIVYSKALRKIRIRTTKETRQVLTDEICVKVIDEKILPQFKEENYYSGLNDGVDELIKLWK